MNNRLFCEVGIRVGAGATGRLVSACALPRNHEGPCLLVSGEDRERIVVLWEENNAAKVGRKLGRFMAYLVMLMAVLAMWTVIVWLVKVLWNLLLGN